jgi:hypothetical protein
MNIIKTNTETLLWPSNEVGLEMSADRIECMLMSRRQNAVYSPLKKWQSFDFGIDSNKST